MDIDDFSVAVQWRPFAEAALRDAHKRRPSAGPRLLRWWPGGWVRRPRTRPGYHRRVAPWSKMRCQEGMWCMSGECDRSMGCIAYGPIPTLTVQGINVQVLGCVSNAEPRWPSVVIADTRGAQSDVENDRINVAVKL